MITSKIHSKSLLSHIFLRLHDRGVITKGTKPLLSLSHMAKELDLPIRTLKLWKARLPFIRQHKPLETLEACDHILLWSGLKILLHHQRLDFKTVQALYKKYGSGYFFDLATVALTRAPLNRFRTKLRFITTGRKITYLKNLLRISTQQNRRLTNKRHFFGRKISEKEYVIHRKLEDMPTVSESLKTKMHHIIDDLKGIKWKIDFLIHKT